LKNLFDSVGIPDPERLLLQRCRQAVHDVDPDVEVILYGSRARGEGRPDSDYDLLILTERSADLEREDRFRRALYPIEMETGAVLTVILLSRVEWSSPLFEAMPFVRNVIREGLRL
jgi:predicted nucleotidyltransferase